MMNTQLDLARSDNCVAAFGVDLQARNYYHVNETHAYVKNCFASCSKSCIIGNFQLLNTYLLR